MKRVILLMTLLAAAGCGSSDSTSPTPLPPTSVGVFTTTDLTIGSGVTAVNGSRVVTSYSGWLYDTGKPFGKGNLFDAGTNGPLSFTIGAANLITGYQQGVVGMRVGGSRRVIIPPELAYMNSSPNPALIPNNATLVFEITLTSAQ